MAKRSSFGCKVRKRLSDITNSHSHKQFLVQEENLQVVGQGTKEDVNQLMKENIALLKLLEERDKIIELSAAELQNLRGSIHKLQVQNWTLAQSNSQLSAVINLARNKVKALQHEIMCKNALLKAKDSDLQGGMNEKSRRPENPVQECENTSTRKIAAPETLHKNAGEDTTKPSDPNRRRTVRSKSTGASIEQKAEADKAKAENKRRRLRRQTVRLKSQEHEESENLFEIEDIQLTMPNNNQQDGPTAPPHKPNTTKKEDKEEEKGSKSDLRPENCTVHRSLIGRPLRRAVEKVHSYKEVPVNIKMRRPERDNHVQRAVSLRPEFVNEAWWEPIDHTKILGLSRDISGSPKVIGTFMKNALNSLGVLPIKKSKMGPVE